MISPKHSVVRALAIDGTCMQNVRMAARGIAEELQYRNILPRNRTLIFGTGLQHLLECTCVAAGANTHSRPQVYFMTVYLLSSAFISWTTARFVSHFSFQIVNPFHPGFQSKHPLLVGCFRDSINSSAEEIKTV